MHADPGYLLFVREGTLMAQPFDLSTLSVTGSPMPVAEDLLYLRDLGQADFSVSTNGVLAYQAGNTQSRLVWFRRNGSEETQVGEPGDYGFTGLSPDETLVATDVMDRRAGTTDIQVFDLARGGKPSSVTLDPTIDWSPVFSPDRQQLAFASARRGPPHVHVKRLNDSSPAEQLVGPSAAVQFVTDWYDGAGGSFIIFQDVHPGQDWISCRSRARATPNRCRSCGRSEMTPTGASRRMAAGSRMCRPRPGAARCTSGRWPAGTIAGGSRPTAA